MIDWLRRVDPAFYYKEPDLLRAQAQIGRYTDEAQAELRLRVLSTDRMLHGAMTITALAGYAAATHAGVLDPRVNWLTLWAFAVLAVLLPRALPWWPRSASGATWRLALIGMALIAIPAIWTRGGPVQLGVAMLAGATLYVARGRGVVALIALAIGVLVGMRCHPIVFALFAGAAVAGASVLAGRAIARSWPRRPQVVTWSALAALLGTCAYTFGFGAQTATLRVPSDIGAIALAYLSVCIMAGRIRRAELIARPTGVLSIPQSIVPLLDRSHHHAIICWLE